MRIDGEHPMDHGDVQEIDTALAAFPGVDSVGIIEREAGEAGRCLVAYVAPASVDMPALHAHAREQLPGHIVPAAIIALDAIPVTTDGTPDVHALPATDLDSLKPYRAPETKRQQVLCDIFAEVLRMPRLGIDDDFFSLGGRSLDAMLIAGKVRAGLGLAMTMTMLFDAPTVAELDLQLSATANTAA